MKRIEDFKGDQTRRSARFDPDAADTPGTVIKNPTRKPVGEGFSLFTDDRGTTLVQDVTSRDITFKPTISLSAHFSALYVAIERGEKNSHPLFGEDSEGRVQELGMVSFVVERHFGSLGALRSRPLDSTKYLWMGPLGLAQNLRLEAARNVEHRPPPRYWREVRQETTGPIRLFLKVSRPGENKPWETQQKPDHSLRKKRKGRGLNSEKTTASRKGTAAGAPQGVTVKDFNGPRKDAKTIMDGVRAVDAAAAAGRVSPDGYQWCHLVGHGDGGKETSDNLIAATTSANTEQLAIEEAFREVRRGDAFCHQAQVAGRGLYLKVTAYPVAGYPNVAAWIRYKIVDEKGAKIVDHRIDGNVEGFTVPQFFTLKENVRRKLLTHFGIDPDAA